MSVKLVIQGTLRTAFEIDRKAVMAEIIAQAESNGLAVESDRSVIRDPTHRVLLDHGGIGNTVTLFVPDPHPLTHVRDAPSTHSAEREPCEACKRLRAFLSDVEQQGVWSQFIILAYNDERSTDAPVAEPVVESMAFVDFPKHFSAFCDQACDSDGPSSIVYFLSLPS